MTTSLSYLFERGKALGRWSLVCPVEKDMAAPLWIASDGQRVAYVRSYRVRSLKTAERLQQVVPWAQAVEHNSVLAIRELIELEGGGGLALVSRYEEGQPLAAVLSKANLARKSVPPAVAACLAIDLLEALQAAGGRQAPPWARGGLRAESVLFSRGGRALAMDLGAAAVMAAVEPLSTDPRWATYASPEQVETGRPSSGSDVFAVAALVLELFTNRPVFGGKSFAEIKGKLLGDDLEGIVAKAMAKVPKALAPVLRRALEPVPGARYATPKAFGDAIAAAVDEVAERHDVAAYLDQVHQVALNRRRRTLEQALGRPAPTSIAPPPRGGASKPPARIAPLAGRLPKLDPAALARSARPPAQQARSSQRPSPRAQGPRGARAVGSSKKAAAAERPSKPGQDRGARAVGPSKKAAAVPAERPSKPAAAAAERPSKPAAAAAERPAPSSSPRSAPVDEGAPSSTGIEVVEATPSEIAAEGFEGAPSSTGIEVVEATPSEIAAEGFEGVPSSTGIEVVEATPSEIAASGDVDDDDDIEAERARVLARLEAADDDDIEAERARVLARLEAADDDDDDIEAERARVRARLEAADDDDDDIEAERARVLARLEASDEPDAEQAEDQGRVKAAEGLDAEPAGDQERAEAGDEAGGPAAVAVEADDEVGAPRSAPAAAIAAAPAPSRSPGLDEPLVDDVDLKSRPRWPAFVVGMAVGSGLTLAAVYGLGLAGPAPPAAPPPASEAPPPPPPPPPPEPEDTATDSAEAEASAEPAAEPEPEPPRRRPAKRRQPPPEPAPAPAPEPAPEPPPPAEPPDPPRPDPYD